MNEKKQFILYLDSDLKEKLTKEAKDKSLTLNAYIRLILMQRKK